MKKEFKPRYSLYKYVSDGKLSMYTLAENQDRLFSEHIAWYDHSSIWEALNKAREIALSKSAIDETKTKLEVNPNLQFVIIEEYAPGKSRIKCIVGQEEIMQEKFHYINK